MAHQVKFMIRDRGSNFTAAFDPVLADGASGLCSGGRPEEAQRLIECGASFLRSRGQPIEVAMVLQHQGSVLRALGAHARSQEAITEARSIIGSCPDPGILTGRLSACGRSPRADTSSGDENLTRRERRVLQGRGMQPGWACRVRDLGFFCPRFT